MQSLPAKKFITCDIIDTKGQKNFITCDIVDTKEVYH